jgi:hypothetical protein
MRRRRETSHLQNVQRKHMNDVLWFKLRRNHEKEVREEKKPLESVRERNRLVLAGVRKKRLFGRRERGEHSQES